MPNFAKVFLSGYTHGSRGFMFGYYFLGLQNSLETI